MLFALLACTSAEDAVDTAPVGPIIQLTPDVLTMTAAVGGAAVETVTVANVGDTTLEIFRVQSGGGRDDPFSVGAIGRVVIPDGESTTFEITFRPEAATHYEGVVLVGSNDSGGTEAEITLSGEGM